LVDRISPIWHEWLCAVREKLETNADHFANARARINYVCSRISEAAAFIISARRRPDAKYPFDIYKEVIYDLSQIYKDVFEEKTASREYKRLY